MHCRKFALVWLGLLCVGTLGEGKSLSGFGSGYWSWTNVFGRRLQQDNAVQYCYDPLAGLEWTSNCFTQCRQRAVFGHKQNIYDFSWRNNNSALLDVLLLNPELANGNNYTNGTSAVLPCYEVALPPNALGGDVAQGRYADQSDTSTSNGPEFAVDGNTATCSLANASSEDVAWWRLNLTARVEVTYIYLLVGTDMEDVLLWVSDTEDPPSPDTDVPCNEAISMGKGRKFGIWCRGNDDEFGRFGMFVWVTAKNSVGLCDVNIYLRGSNAATFKPIVSASDARSMPNLAAVTDDNPSTAGWLQARSSSRSAFFAVDLGYSGTVQAISFYHISNTSLNVTVRVGDSEVRTGNENNLCSIDSYVVVPKDTAVIFACRNVLGRYVTLSIPGPGTMVVRDFGVYLYVSPEVAGPSPSPIIVAPPTVAPALAPSAPAIAQDQSLENSNSSVPPSQPPPLTLPQPGEEGSYVSVMMQLLGPGLPLWNDSTRELQFEPALLSSWNSSAAPITELVYLQENNSGSQLLVEYEVSAPTPQIDGIRQDIGNSINNATVTTAVREAGLEVDVKLITLSTPYLESKQGDISSNITVSPIITAPPSERSSFPTAAIIAIVVTVVLALIVGMVLGLYLTRRRRQRRHRKMDSFTSHKLPLSQASGMGTPNSHHRSNGSRGGSWFGDEHTAMAISKKTSSGDDGTLMDNSTLIAANSLMDTIYENKKSGNHQLPTGMYRDEQQATNSAGSTPASHGNTPASTHMGSPWSDHVSEVFWRPTTTASRVGQIERLWQVNYADVEIQKQIGEGSFGKVFLAKWKETIVAVKVLSSPEWGDWSAAATEEEDMLRQETVATLLGSLEKEAAMMATLRHPNVVMYLGICLEPPCVVTEYCSRGSLNDVLKRARLSKSLAAQIDWAKRLSMALDAAKGMLYLHSSEPPIIHRDLKSPNLLVDKHWRVKVCDFNLSRFMEEQAVLSSVAATNPRWLAPEILSGQGYTCSSDVYSFGIILWELLSWQVPWHEYGPWQVVAMVTDGQQRPEIPPEEKQPSPTFAGQEEYIQLMNECWAQRSEDRPSFSTIISRLRQLLANEANLKAESRAASVTASSPEQSSLQSDQTPNVVLQQDPDPNSGKSTRGQSTDDAAFNDRDNGKAAVVSDHTAYEEQHGKAAIRSDCTAYNEQHSGKMNHPPCDTASTSNQSMTRSTLEPSTSGSLQFEPLPGDASPDQLEPEPEPAYSSRDVLVEAAAGAEASGSAGDGGGSGVQGGADKGRKFSWGDAARFSFQGFRHMRMGSFGSLGRGSKRSSPPADAVEQEQSSTVRLEATYSGGARSGQANDPGPTQL